MQRPLRYLVPAAAALALGACAPDTPSTGVVTAPLTPAPSATAGAAATPSPAASPSPTLPPGVFFRDDFDGDKLDPSRWKAFEREGYALVRGGHLELASGGLTRGFPLVVPTADNIPRQGPYYLEVRYQMLSLGKVSGFNLDYIPPVSGEDPSVTEPFLRWGTYQQEIMFVIDTETRNYGPVAFGGSLSAKAPHRFRIEFDGEGSHRVIFDDAELMVVPSKRRPTKLWFGAYPNDLGAPSTWSSWKVDYVESGVLVSPDPATPRPTPTPRPSATAKPTPSATATPTPPPSAAP